MHPGTRKTIHERKRARSKQSLIGAESHAVSSVLHPRGSDSASHKESRGGVYLARTGGDDLGHQDGGARGMSHYLEKLLERGCPQSSLV